tara:strand:+ start:585 stop:1379 length:795 start_codon:yes stop_codon:yes gene_type:complete
MAFRTDGSSHKSGVKREVKLANDFQNNKVLAEAIVNTKLSTDYVSQHIGGTTHKEDITITSNGTTHKISLKKKEKGICVGSFDWINSSKVTSSEVFKEVRELYSECRVKYHGEKDKVEHVRKLINDQSNQTLENMTSEQVWSILEKNIINPYKNSNIMLLIDDISSNKIYCIDSIKETELYDHYLKRTPITLANPSGKAKSSRVIMFDEKNIGLRIRVVSNNGIGALLGIKKKSSSNSNSKPTVKIQQDNVSGFIKKCKNIRVV